VADGTGITLEHIAVAAQPVRFGLLGLSTLGWFRASAVADALHVKRGTVRLHADELVEQELAERREVVGAPKQTFEWRITRLGSALHAQLADLVGELVLPAPAGVSVPATLLAVGGDFEPDELAAALGERVVMTEPVPGFWISGRSEPRLAKRSTDR
jgi:hypothetical protein